MKHLAVCLASALYLSVSHADLELYTNIYVVPPTFLSTDNAMGSPPPRYSRAQGVLERKGIKFPDGSSAIYNKTSSQLIVRNTQDQLKQVEAYIETLIGKVEAQIYITIHELSFKGKPKIVEALENRYQEEAQSWPPTAEGSTILGSREVFLHSLRATPEEITQAPVFNSRGIIGVLSDFEIEPWLKDAVHAEGIDVLQAPAYVIRKGQYMISRHHEKRWGLTADIGPNNDTIDLELFLPPHGKIEGFFDSTKVRIWDGRTIAFYEERTDQQNRIVLIRSQLIDPAGLPVNEQVEAKKNEQASVEH